MGSKVVTVYVFLTIFGCAYAQGYYTAFSIDDMARLEDDLLTGYKVSTRPASQTNVTVSMLISNVLELISTWLYSDATVQLRHSTIDMISQEMFEENSEWEVSATQTSYVDRTLYYQPYRALAFSITLQRRTSYYVLYVLVPVLVFNLVGVVVFAVPPGSGEKLSFSLTMLLAITVLMTIVGEKIPTSSMQVSKLGAYLVCSMVLSILEVIITVLILRLYNAGQENMPVSKSWRIVANVLQFPRKLRNCCKSGGTNRPISVSPLVTKVDLTNQTIDNSTDANGNSTKDMKPNHDGDQYEDSRELGYKEIAEKMDWFCLVVFLAFIVVMSVGFIIAALV